MRQLFSRARILWRGLRRPAQLDADMRDEMRFHIEMETERRIQQGLDPAEARRQAAIAFGGIEKYRGAGRDVLGVTWLRGLSTDTRLGVRMLMKHPGLTLVAVFALSLAIGAGAGYLEFTRDLMHGRLPFPDGDRIVGIQNWDQQSGDPEHRATFEFVSWRGRLASIEDLGAYRALNRNLIAEDGRAEPVRGVEISASAFHIAGVPPLHGRPLVPDDERAGAAPVVVLGYDVWTGRFGSDPSVVGRAVKLDQAHHTVVGVMPPGFGFPISHSLWVPLQLGNTAPPGRSGAPLRIFGKLAAGYGTAQAQAELTAIALQAANAFPETQTHIRPVVKLYVQSLWSAVEDSEIQTIVFYAANLFFVGLLVVCGANIATLVFARTATREAEISVRTALGASRARIAGQLFAEALVLTSMAAVIGLAVAYFGLLWVMQVVAEGQGQRTWFWWNDQLSPETFAYAALLAIVAAVMIGVVPALKATGPRVQDRLKHATGGSAPGLKFGGIWTGVIVSQVALTVVFLAVTGTLGWGLFFQNAGDRELTFRADQYVVMRLNMDRELPNGPATDPEEDARFRRRLGARYDDFARRATAEPAVRGISYGSRVPGMNHLSLPIEVEGLAVPDEGVIVKTAATGVRLLTTFNATVVAGRAFTEADLAPGREVAVVDQSFVRHVLGGGNAVGRRYRKAAGREHGAEAGPWVEIVGVVGDLTSETHKKASDAVVYRPTPADATYPLYVAVHVAGDTTPVMWRLRVLGAEVDPSLRLDEVQTLDQLKVADRVAIDFFLRLLGGIGLVALVLATAGVYALMAFTVSRRTTEIGIRLALGASSGRIVMTTFSRALAQVGLGVLVGSVPAVAIAASLGPEVAVSASATTTAVICITAAGVVAVVTLLACYVPARRALGIQPTDALKAT
ncbi:MAG: ABC transporter permease [Acidobacteriota bacterium]|nr:ABC transporter permease [Acidobacteriota bacterium]